MDKLLEFTDNSNCQVFYNKMNDTKSLSMQLDDNLYINIDDSQINTAKGKRVCLAHELGHCISGTLYTLDYSNLYRGRAEYRADYRGAQLVIPIDDFKEMRR